MEKNKNTTKNTGKIQKIFSPWIYEFSLVPPEATVMLLLTELGVLYPAGMLL